MSNLKGQSLGRYRILEPLGEGGMATVYKAFDTRLERDVAIKVIRRETFPPNQLDRILKRFEREAKALAKLSHPNIVGVIDYGDYEGSPYLVMEFLTSGTLKDRLGKPIPWQEAARLLLPVARALEYAHKQGVVHRDIKPSNILITESGEPMLADFGIAKIIESEETATLTGTGIGIGTPEYMAPEQWTGNTTTQSDLYSLGIVFYEMITGRKPYTADTPAAILLKQSNQPLPRPTQFVINLPEGVERILLQALALKPEDRYQDMGAFANGLERVLSGGAFEKIPAEAGQTEALSEKPATPSHAGSALEEEATRDELISGQSATPAQSTPVPNIPQSFIKKWWIPGIAFTSLCACVFILSTGGIIGMSTNFFGLAGGAPTDTLVQPTATNTPTATPTTSSTLIKTPTPTKTNTPNGVPGITLPVTINGVEIKFTDLHEESEILFGTERYTPKSSSDTFIVANADVLTSGTSHQEVADWAVSLNQDIAWVFMQSHGDTNSITSVEWTFVVSKSASAYQIHLPGGVDVILTSLLR